MAAEGVRVEGAGYTRANGRYFVDASNVKAKEGQPVFYNQSAFSDSVCDWPWQQQTTSRKMLGLGVGFRHSQYAFC
jgi:hypothetical protein